MPRLICQSCGMPLRDDEQFGTNDDGTRNSLYCINCYRDGQFTWKDATAEQMQIYCTGILMKRHWPGFAAKMATHNIPKLARWHKV